MDQKRPMAAKAWYPVLLWIELAIFEAPDEEFSTAWRNYELGRSSARLRLNSHRGKTYNRCRHSNRLPSEVARRRASTASRIACLFHDRLDTVLRRIESSRPAVQYSLLYRRVSLGQPVRLDGLLSLVDREEIPLAPRNFPGY
ncbi:hypothetical protein Bbelb_260190 [Branchiostoma belcheri]|nr:hypothetical protein Bbelb_260190 [Branchiostoma belcheri]